MHSCELVELAALVAAHAKVLALGPEQIPESCIQQYWVASRSRLDRWGRTLKRLRTGRGRPHGAAQRPDSPWVRGALEEIVTGEVLTRVWAAVMTAYDRHHQVDLMEPVARGVFISHLEARHRLLALLVCCPRIDAELALKLNRLRRRTERWTDMLIGGLAGVEGTQSLAVDQDRAKEFGEDLRWQQSHKGGRHTWPLILASLKASFGQGLCSISPNADINAKIGCSILSCFRSGSFDSTGLIQSPLLLRISHVAQDTQGMIDELLALEGGTGRTRQGWPADSRALNRLWRFGE
jgi:hypothetical protein